MTVCVEMMEVVVVAKSSSSYRGGYQKHNISNTVLRAERDEFHAHIIGLREEIF